MTEGRSKEERKVKLSSQAGVLEMIQPTLWATLHNHFNWEEITSSISSKTKVQLYWYLSEDSKNL